MVKRNPALPIAEKDNEICARQIAFFAAFVLPTYKLVEVPALLSRFVSGDLLLPALLQYLLQTLTLVALLYAASRSEKSLFERMELRLGKWSRCVYGAYALAFLGVAVLPLLDLEKLTYAVFYDTSPTLFSFAAFFLFSAFVAVKGVKAVSRIGDISLFLFLLPFLALLVMALVEVDVTNLLPFFSQPFGNSVKSVGYTTPHFADTLLLLPLVGNLRYQKGDGKKILVGYLGGATCTLLFLAVFYSVFASLAMRTHYAFTKIAQYFPVLSVVGRIDLLFVYMLCIVLFFFVATPLRHATDCAARAVGLRGKTILSCILHLGAFFFVLFCNKYYNAVYAFFGKYTFPLFWLFSNLLPLLFLLLKGDNTPTQKENVHA